MKTRDWHSPGYRLGGQHAWQAEGPLRQEEHKRTVTLPSWRSGQTVLSRPQKSLPAWQGVTIFLTQQETSKGRIPRSGDTLVSAVKQLLLCGPARTRSPARVRHKCSRVLDLPDTPPQTETEPSTVHFMPQCWVHGRWLTETLKECAVHAHT